MGKYFSASTQHAKGREFLKLKQGVMMVLEYVAKFTELARFVDDYVATDMAKVRKFEDALKLSIRGKIIGLLPLEGFRDKAMDTKAKAKISHPKMGDTLGLLASKGRECVSNATSFDT